MKIKWKPRTIRQLLVKPQPFRDNVSISVSLEYRPDMNSESCPSLVWLVSQLSEQTSGSISSCSPSLCASSTMWFQRSDLFGSSPGQRDVGSNPEGKTLPELSLRSCVAHVIICHMIMWGWCYLWTVMVVRLAPRRPRRLFLPEKKWVWHQYQATGGIGLVITGGKCSHKSTKYAHARRSYNHPICGLGVFFTFLWNPYVH